MTSDERKLLLLLASIIGPASLKWREVRDLIAAVRNAKEDTTDAV